MADWYGHARSNYFRVKDKDAFNQWASALDMEVIEDEEGRFGLISNDERGRWPCWKWNEETDEDEDVDVAEQLAVHLADGSVAVLMEVGNEKMRYLTGWAEAINSYGQRVLVSLDDIYEKAEQLGHEVTTATY